MTATRLIIASVVAALAIVVSYISVQGDPAPARATRPASPATPSQSHAVRLDLYPLLALSREEIASAADLAIRFVAAYGTNHPGETHQAFLRRLGPMISPPLRSALQQARRRVADSRSTGTASLRAIRAIEPTSVIFVIAGTEHIIKSTGSSRRDERYEITAALDEQGQWSVFAFQPAGTGQSGESS